MKHPILYIFMAAGIFTGCGGGRKPAAAIPLHVSVERAFSDSVPYRMEFVGQTDGTQSALLQPRVNGYLLAMHYRRGMPVHRGQLLFEIDPGEAQAGVRAAEASLASARAQLVQAANDHERAVPLAAINAISRSQLDMYSARLEAARAGVEVALSQLHDARLALGYTKIHAPIDGIIGVDDLSLGEYVGPGTRHAVLNTISRTDSVRVEIALPVARYLEIAEHIRATGGKIHPAYQNRELLSNVRMTLPGGGLYPWPGRYLHTAQSVGAGMGTIALTVIFPNPEGLLKAGEYARITADVGPPRRSVLVPQRAVSESQGVSSVWVLKADSTVEYRRVTPAGTWNRYRILTGGIEAGEAVLTSGQQKIRQGMKVSASEAATADSTAATANPPGR